MLTPFQRFILNFYHHHGRHHLPWRQGYNPYHVLISEIMLQQTQVERVIPKFLAFIAAFPTINHLASAPQSEVIKQWQGLGYNRRGLHLKSAAQHMVNHFGSAVPDKLEKLLHLPGIGPYTAAAIRAFAFNQPEIVIETNIRTVYLYHFFPASPTPHSRESDAKITDAQLVPLIQSTMDTANPRTWYSALMDYGAYLKSVLPNPSRRSSNYAKQSTFRGSLRQVRGQVLKSLALRDNLSQPELTATIEGDVTKLNQALDQLTAEGFIERSATRFSLKK